MRHTFSGPAVADCLPISYILRIESGSKSHGAVPLDFANMMSQPARGPSMNQRRPCPSIICQTEITSTTLFCRFRKRGSWARKDSEIYIYIGVISGERSPCSFVTMKYPLDVRFVFPYLCDTRNRIHQNYIDFKSSRPLSSRDLCYGEIFIV